MPTVYLTPASISYLTQFILSTAITATLARRLCQRRERKPQCILLTVTDKHIPYAQSVYEKLTEAGIRCEKFFENEKLGYKIRQAQMQKIPYMLVIGDKEQESGQVALRLRNGENPGPMLIADFIAYAKEEVASKK